MDTQVQTWEANAYHTFKVRGDSAKPRAKTLKRLRSLLKGKDSSPPFFGNRIAPRNPRNRDIKNEIS